MEHAAAGTHLLQYAGAAQLLRCMAVGPSVRERRSDRATERQRGPGGAPPATLDSQTEGMKDDEELSVKELAGFIRGRQHVVHRVLHSTNSGHLFTRLCCMRATCLHSQRDGIERDPVLRSKLLNEIPM